METSALGACLIIKVIYFHHEATHKVNVEKSQFSHLHLLYGQGILHMFFIYIVKSVVCSFFNEVILS
jgi:hypothetical protein